MKPDRLTWCFSYWLTGEGAEDWGGVVDVVKAHIDKYLKHLTNTYCAGGQCQLLRAKLSNLGSPQSALPLPAMQNAPREQSIVMWQLLLFRATNSNLLRCVKFSVVCQWVCVGVCVCVYWGQPFWKTVGLSKVHLPWLRHRNILEACNDNISSKRQRPLQPPFPSLGLGQQLPAGALGFERLLLPWLLLLLLSVLLLFSFCGNDETLMTQTRTQNGAGAGAGVGLGPCAWPLSEPGQFKVTANPFCSI